MHTQKEHKITDWDMVEFSDFHQWEKDSNLKARLLHIVSNFIGVFINLLLFFASFRRGFLHYMQKLVLSLWFLLGLVIIVDTSIFVNKIGYALLTMYLMTTFFLQHSIALIYRIGLGIVIPLIYYIFLNIFGVNFGKVGFSFQKEDGTTEERLFCRNTAAAAVDGSVRPWECNDFRTTEGEGYQFNAVMTDGSTRCVDMLQQFSNYTKAKYVGRASEPFEHPQGQPYGIFELHVFAIDRRHSSG